MEKPLIKNLTDGIDIEFGYDKTFNDSRPKKIIVYKNRYSSHPKAENIIPSVMNKFGFSISYSDFENKDVTYESKIITALTSKKGIK